MTNGTNDEGMTTGDLLVMAQRAETYASNLLREYDGPGAEHLAALGCMKAVAGIDAEEDLFLVLWIPEVSTGDGGIINWLRPRITPEFPEFEVNLIPAG